MHPARQKRLGAALLILIASAFAAATVVPALAAPAAFPADYRQGRQPPPPHPRVDKKKEAKKRTPLAADAAWSQDLPAASSAGPGYDDAHIFVPLRSGEVVALSLEKGATAWRAKVQANGSPAAGDRLVFVPTQGSIEALDAETGEARWSHALDAPLSAPLVWQNGWLLAGTANGAATMLRATTGEQLWRRDLPSKMRAAAALTGDRLYVPLESRQVLALKLATGETIWERTLGGRPTTLAPLDDRVFVGADDKFFYCLSWKNGKVDWRWRTGGAIVGTPAIDQDFVYFLSLDNVLRALDRGNGTQAWHSSMTFRPLAGPALNAGLLLVSGLGGVHAYQRVDGSEAGGVEVPDVLAAPPHFLRQGEDLVSPFVIVTREGQVRLILPTPPPIPSKPFPPKMIYPFWPGESGSGL